MKKLIIFDFDGVVVDSEIIANRIDSEQLSLYGYSISTEESIRKFTGMNSMTVREFIRQESGIILPENIFEVTQKSTLEAFETELKPLIYEVLDDPLFEGISKCIASSSSNERILKSLYITKQSHFFKNEHIFNSSQVNRGKPFPDLFLFAAEKMGVARNNCFVIEDSVVGIHAALSAGMPVVAFLGGSHAHFEWYYDQILELNVPVVFNSEDLLKKIKSFI